MKCSKGRRSEKGNPRGGQAGFTLLETLVAVGILATLLSLGSHALYQASSVRWSWQSNMTSVRDLRQSGSWFAGDALSAVTTSLTDGAAPVGSVTLTLTDSSGVSHTTSYAVTQGNLVRTYDGKAMTMAGGVTAAAFSLSSKILTLQLTTAAAPGQTESSTLKTYLRLLP